MSYSTLLKYGTVPYKEEEMVIDVNARVEESIQKAIALYGIKEEPSEKSGEEGFQEGIAALGAEQIDGLLADDSPVLKADETELARINEEKEAALNELAEIQQQLESAKQEAQKILNDAKAQAGGIKEDAKRAGHDEGYNMGLQEAEAQFQAKEQELEERHAALEQEYDERFNAMEPEFIDNLTAIYEHIFHVDLLDERGVLLYLIEKTMRDVGVNSNFLIHVSPADYPMVQENKGELTALTEGNHVIEIIEDNALSQGGAMVETDNGIFDCGIDTELKELSRKLRLLSYERGGEVG